MNMKKLAAAALCLLLALSLLAACGASPASGDAAVDNARDDALKEVKNRGEMIIGFETESAPLHFYDEQQNLAGFDVELATAVCQYLGVTPVFRMIEWDTRQSELDSGTIDCLWGIADNAQNQETLGLTQSYISNRIVVMSMPEATVSGKSDLPGLRIGVQSSSSAVAALRADSIWAELSENVSEYPTYNDALFDLSINQLDCIVVDELYGSYRNAQLDGRFALNNVDFGSALYVVGVSKQDLSVARGINEALDALIADGTMSAISQTWFGADILPAAQASDE